MRPSDFYFDLPDDLIAQQPADERSSSRMLVVDRTLGNIEDSHFSRLPSKLIAGDLVVFNNTKVFPARLYGKSETGAAIEIFLVKKLEGNVWETLARPGRRLHTGKRVAFSSELSATVVDKLSDGKFAMSFNADGDIDDQVDTIGRTPLPPYIKRERDSADDDRTRYQTVYAKKRGAIAAPTAGLHFTPKVIDELRALGIETAEITLHVGYGTFEPIRAADLVDHSVMPEEYEIDQAAAEQLNLARRDGRRIIAIGTTTTRTLESNISHDGIFSAIKSNADLTITPGYRFRATDGLLTNFHLPESSLLVLTSTFGGHELIMDAYRHAVAAAYRFYSYGDCMLII